MLATIALAVAVLVSIGAAALGSWVVLELLLRLAEAGHAKSQVPTAKAPGETPVIDVTTRHSPTKTSLPKEQPPSEPRIGSVTR